jgi:hypothetical protein
MSSILRMWSAIWWRPWNFQSLLGWESRCLSSCLLPSSCLALALFQKSFAIKLYPTAALESFQERLLFHEEFSPFVVPQGCDQAGARISSNNCLHLLLQRQSSWGYVLRWAPDQRSHQRWIKCQNYRKDPYGIAPWIALLFDCGLVSNNYIGWIIREALHLSDLMGMECIPSHIYFPQGTINSSNATQTQVGLINALCT